MALALSSEQTWRYWLKRGRLMGDDGKELAGDEHRAHFVMKCLTGREQRKLAEALDALEVHPNTEPTAAYVDLCFAAARAAGVVRHFADNASRPVEIAPADLDDVVGLGYCEARELAYAAFRGGITPGDLGKSDSPSSSASGSSASPDGAGDARPADTTAAPQENDG